MNQVVKQMLLFWLMASVLATTLSLAVLGTVGGGSGVSEAVGRILLMTGIAALLSGWVARKRLPPWEAWRFARVYAAMLMGLVIATTLVGQARAADAPAPIEVRSGVG